MIYLDNAGTTKVSNQAKEAMMPFLDEIYGNTWKHPDRILQNV